MSTLHSITKIKEKLSCKETCVRRIIVYCWLFYNGRCGGALWDGENRYWIADSPNIFLMIDRSPFSSLGAEIWWSDVIWVHHFPSPDKCHSMRNAFQTSQYIAAKRKNRKEHIEYRNKPAADFPSSIRENHKAFNNMKFWEEQIAYFPLKRNGPLRKRCLQLFLVYLFTELMPRKDRGYTDTPIHFPLSRQLSCWCLCIHCLGTVFTE
jgi:hypothetical protein